MIVPVSGAVFDGSEAQALRDLADEFDRHDNPRIAAGKRALRFERDLAEWFGVRYALTTNSGSSANLLAIAALCSPQLPGGLRPGDEVITVACGFPTTVAPLIQMGLVPVFVDVRAPDYNVDASQLEAAMSPRVKAVALAHTLGFPFNVAAVAAFCAKHRLYLVEDNCDAAGAWVDVGSERCLTGTFGRLATLSFYPAHHMTTGEGGAVLTSDRDLAKIVASLRDWGRDCHCPPGCDNTCGRRFDQEHGSLPVGYDHKYVYSHLGYSLRMTEMQAAIGIVQLSKLGGFIARRRATWRFYRDALADLGDVFEFADPPSGCDPSPFGFLMTVRDGYSRDGIVAKLEAARIQTRPLFAGNLLRHPAMRRGVSYRTMQLPVTDSTVFSAFWIGVYPGITDEMREYVVDQIRRIVR